MGPPRPEDEEKCQALTSRHTRRLDLGLPLLSTQRPDLNLVFSLG